MSDESLAALRKSRNESWNAFQANPTELTKAQYKAAQSAYYSARKQHPEVGTRSWPKPVEFACDELENARLAANAANRAKYANPNEETREAARLAKNHFQNLRRKLDPEFKAKQNANWEK